MTLRAALASMLVLAPFAAHADAVDAACPPGTELREAAREFACTTPAGVGEGLFWAVGGDGRIQYRGTARRGEPHGTWTSWHANGVRAKEAEYRDGVLVGSFREWDEAGQLVSAGRHDAAGEMDGTWTRWWPNGRKRIEWTMQHGVADGSVTAWWDNGERKLRGRREAGLREGTWTWWDESGAVTAQCRFAHGAVVAGACGPDGPADR